ncbi:MAG: hypothetical protein NVSMB23_01390 [Myxococcales bacterium]
MIATVLGLVLLAAPVDLLPKPVPGRCLFDPHGALDAASAAQLEEACARLDRSGDGQLAIAVVDENDMGDLGRDEFAAELFRKWGIGHKGRDDGVLVVLKTGSAGHRSARVEVGYGLEGALPDGKVGALLDQLAIPSFRAGRYGEGLVRLVGALVPAVHAEAASGGLERRRQLQKQSDDEARAAGKTFAGLLAALLAWAAILFGFRVVKHAPGPGARLAGYGLLGGGAVAALALGGPYKGQLLVAWAIFSGIGALAFFAVQRHRCPKCGGWKSVETELLRAPTFWRDGEALVVERCSRCDYRRSYRKPIARRAPTVFVGGGGGWGGGGGGWSGGGGGGGDDGGGFSGFGGGSSGGGGGGRDF